MRSIDDKGMKKQAANIITGLRVVFSIGLLFLTPLSPAFFALYIAAGLTDMVDGTVARMTGSVSEFGSKLDTLADIVFTAVCMIKLLPVRDIPVWTYCWAGGIALIKAVTLAIGCIRLKRFTAVHSLLNKITGAMLFALPLTLPFIGLRFSSAAVCTAASFAATQECRTVIKKIEK